MPSSGLGLVCCYNGYCQTSMDLALSRACLELCGILLAEQKNKECNLLHLGLQLQKHSLFFFLFFFSSLNAPGNDWWIFWFFKFFFSILDGKHPKCHISGVPFWCYLAVPWWLQEAWPHECKSKYSFYFQKELPCASEVLWSCIRSC